jgi:23S rRNA (cytidine1920-2'-O)/16S rRNA (cytidine1409-2'-O)-methyltransferase
MGKEKERLDALLVERGLFDSREKAKAAVMAGIVYTGDERLEKPGMKVARDIPLHVKGALHPYVSRGGLKLEKAIRSFGLDLKDRVMLDIGASTGGFTDCAIQHGVSFVYAIDVGYNQLDWSLRSHPKVKVMERTNFRYMKPGDLHGPAPDFAAIDVSFISLKLILPALRDIFAEAGRAGGTGAMGECVALIKPQFEAGREQVGKSGVVRDPAVHREVLADCIGAASQIGFFLKGLTYSPITGGEGNIEFLAHWKLDSEGHGLIPSEKVRELIDQVVREAHGTFS